MGSATIQGQLWGSRAQDFAAYLEQLCLPLHGAVLDAAHVTAGTRLLDAGCGAGLLALLASLRGAQVAALDASAALLAIAQGRLPDADVRQGDLEALPFDDASFDAVTAVNSLFYAAHMSAAMRELVRVVRPGGRVVVTAWGPPDRCELLAAALAAVGPLMPPPPPGVRPPQPEPCRARASGGGPGASRVARGRGGRDRLPLRLPQRRGVVARECQRGRQPGGDRAQRGGSGSRCLRGGRPRPHPAGWQHPLRQRLPLGGGRTTVATAAPGPSAAPVFSTSTGQSAPVDPWLTGH